MIPLFAGNRDEFEALRQMLKEAFAISYWLEKPQVLEALANAPDIGKVAVDLGPVIVHLEFRAGVVTVTLEHVEK